MSWTYLLGDVVGLRVLVRKLGGRDVNRTVVPLFSSHMVMGPMKT